MSSGNGGEDGAERLLREGSASRSVTLLKRRLALPRASSCVTPARDPAASQPTSRPEVSKDLGGHGTP
ncbi:hypothetical protein CDV36_009519 [Fusarium kuroshium]|uniref:Uncharacterized protein n=3 Tax=Fusarium solani species complex TaxID=232080 RepID=A0A3M2RZY5_9HYPO|nr:hypothetical protein CDV36_009519 [Fusarium kuroshium]RSL92288.1 hypothetical protein CDV31_015223 [Fusarium ambrosium]RSL96915.1 hypothetical protein CEP52_011162 [Fusarium oligoseptatum]